MHLEFDVLELHTRHAFHIARETAPPVRRSVWVRLRDEEGREGWGEATATSFYGETADTVTALLPRLADAVFAATDGDPFRLERAEAALDGAIGGNAAAKSALSAALHDLVGKRLGVPVWTLWGLEPRVPLSSFTIGIDEPEAMRAKIREAASYPILKIKVGTENDEALLRMVRDEAPDKTIRVDANTGWTVKQALRALPMLRDFGVELVEQPLVPGDLDGLRLLRECSPLPIFADESCVRAVDVPRLAGCVDGVNVKLSKCGSLREALRIVHCARAHHLQVMLGCMVETTLGIAAAAQIAPLVDFLDLDGTALLAEDPFRGPRLDPDGTFHLNREPGLGVTLAND